MTNRVLARPGADQPEVGLQDLTQWSCAATAPGLFGHPRELDQAVLDWMPATAPGTAAAAMRAAGRWSMGDDHDFDSQDWWFRCSFGRAPMHGRCVLDFAGLATVAQVWLNDQEVLASANMYRSHHVVVDQLSPADNHLVIRCAALRPMLAKRRPRPGWKTRVVGDQNLRWFRTSLLGRMPSWTPPLAPVGPWGPISLRPEPPVEVSSVRLRANLDDSVGRVELSAQLVAHDADVLEVSLVIGGHRATLHCRTAEGRTTVSGQGSVPDARPWWPWTHGDQPLYPVQLVCRTTLGEQVVDLGRTGFRTVDFGSPCQPELVVNGTAVFCRGGGWAPDPVTPWSSSQELRSLLEAVRGAGMNMVRVPGGTVYPTPAFYDLCDELGILVWQDLMFANMDYPVDDPDFLTEVIEEVTGVLAALAGRPCLAAVCGGSEVAQQAAMMGRPLGSSARLFDQVLADLVTAYLPDAAYWAHSPMGGTHPFTVDVGISHYYGVGGYRRPLADARLAGVRFATECLGLAHTPDDEAVEELLASGCSVHDPAWKRRVFRDTGASWDSEDARDSYIRELFGLDPAEIRFRDPNRYLDLGRATSVTVMERTLTEWRRPTSTCRGALVFMLRDLWDGAGPGILDGGGRPKPAFYPLRRVLSPTALLLCDEGLNGLDVWALNDGPGAIEGTVRVTAYSGQAIMAMAETPLALAPHSGHRLHAEEVLGEFLDVTYAYRFGPRAVDCVAVHWWADGALLSRAVFCSRPDEVERREIGLRGQARPVSASSSEYELEVTADRLARCVMLNAAGCWFSDNYFDVEPGGRVQVQVRTAQPLRVRLRALNSLDGETITVRPAAGPAADGRDDS